MTPKINGNARATYPIRIAQSCKNPTIFIFVLVHVVTVVLIGFFSNVFDSLLDVVGFDVIFAAFANASLAALRCLNVFKIDWTIEHSFWCHFK